jgi:hypothetical protein
VVKRTLAFLLVVLALVGCSRASSPATSGNSQGDSRQGSSTAETSSDAASAIVDATKTTLGAGTVHMDFTMAMVTSGQSIDFGGTADVDFESGRQHMVMEFPSLAPGAPSGEMEMILDGTVMYMRAPSFGQMLGVGDGWIKMDLEDLGSELGDVSSFTGTQNDPSQSLAYLAGALEAEELGPDQVAGVPATHYRTTVDMVKAVEEVPAEVRDTVEESVEQFRAQFGSTSFPIEVWIGEDGHILRQQMEFEFPGGTVGTGVPGGGTMVMVVDYSSFGEKVVVRTPPASQVTDFSDIAGYQP